MCTPTRAPARLFQILISCLRVVPWRRGVKPSLTLGLAFLLAASPSSLRAERALTGPRLLPNAGAEIRVTNTFEGIPPSGFLPIRIEIKNSADTARSWNLQSKHALSGSRITDFFTTLTVPASSERAFDLLVPLSPQVSSSSRYSSLTLTFLGPGIEDGIITEHSSGGGRSPSVYLGMGEALATTSWGVLREQVEKKLSLSLNGSPLDPLLMPSDWRGLAGFEGIVLAASEWRDLAAGPRAALLDWVAQGGHLVLAYEEETAPPDLAALPSSRGGGKILIRPVIGLEDELTEWLKAASKPIASMALQDYNWKWAPAQAVGNPEPPYLLILIFVVLFALIIGPLNFLVLAPAGRRHRLFWTTPAISLAASILTGVFITIREGAGGRGQRFEALLVLPEERRAVLWQEQISRTGVLFSSSFPSDNSAVLLPIEIRSENQTPRPRRRAESIFALAGSQWSGDWFRSRTTQAQLLTALAPQRERLDVSWENGVPSATSSFARPLDMVFYFSPNPEGATIWQGRDLKPGQKTVLTPATMPAYLSWRERTLIEAGPVIRDRLSRFEAQRGGHKFFANTLSASAIATLGEIIWSDTGGLIFGETVETAPAPPAES